MLPRTGFRRSVRTGGCRRAVVGQTRLPQIGLPIPESSSHLVSVVQPDSNSAALSLEGSVSSTALLEAAAALSPRSLCAKHVAVQKDNFRLQREVASLRSRSCGLSDEGMKAMPFSFVFLYASPLCFMCNQTHSKLLPNLDAESETDAIQQALGAAYPVEAEAATALSLRRTAQRPGIWLHVCAHTVEVAPGKRSVMLEDQGIQPMAMKLSAKELEMLLLANGRTSGSFAFLAMCHSSEFRGAFRKAGFQHIVDCESEVQDRHAAKFARDLYASLADGQSLMCAFQFARTCAQARGDYASYNLNGDGSLRLPHLVTHTSGLSFAGPLAACGELPHGAEDFVGRVPQICEVFMAMQARHVIVLHSAASNGRTEILRQIGQYANRKGRHFAGRCAFYPAKAPPGGLLIVDDADYVLDSRARRELVGHLQSHRGARLLLACREPCYDALLDCGYKPHNVLLPPLQDHEATELFLRCTHRPLTEADSPQSIRAGAESPCRIMPKAEAQRTLRPGIGVFAGEPGKVRKAGVAVRPGSPPLDLPTLGSR